MQKSIAGPEEEIGTLQTMENEPLKERKRLLHRKSLLPEAAFLFEITYQICLVSAFHWLILFTFILKSELYLFLFPSALILSLQLYLVHISLFQSDKTLYRK